MQVRGIKKYLFPIFIFIIYLLVFFSSLYIELCYTLFRNSPVIALRSSPFMIILSAILILVDTVLLTIKPVRKRLQCKYLFVILITTIIFRIAYTLSFSLLFFFSDVALIMSILAISGVLINYIISKIGDGSMS